MLVPTRKAGRHSMGVRPQRMKKDQIKKNLHSRVKLRPIAKSFLNGVEREQFDDDWIIENVPDEGVVINNPRMGYSYTLGVDHIHSYTSDPNRNYDGFKHGILVLNVQLSIDLNTRTISIEPTERPGRPV
jgi:hypothetical protein